MNNSLDLSASDKSYGIFRLPEKYSDLSPLDKREALNSSILALLKVRGTVTGVSKSELKANIDPHGIVNYNTWSKALDHLTTTQQVYVDSASGSRDPVYYPNGRMAHPKLQKMFDTLLHKYTVRAYDTRLGKTITITQYSKTVSGDEFPIAGIRLDWQDMRGFIAMLEEELKSLEDRGLVKEE
ncbi:MAG TPA: hypothetical protein VJ944_04465 [Thermoplasmataceae archaeon]|nr:hypothetical protein [Thermoplasmataceae archaeon]